MFRQSGNHFCDEYMLNLLISREFFERFRMEDVPEGPAGRGSGRS
jgi:hypothetical protein